MTSTIVASNQLKGNYAQSVATDWLSRRCLIRPVAEGTDIGIDLYCESTVEGQPFLHFWVQVKAIPAKNIKTVNGERTASFRFETKHLVYWDRQPIPVYALLVPLDGWPPSNVQEIFGIPITRRLVEKGLPSTNTVTYRTSDRFEANSLDTDLDLFISRIVPWDTSAMLLKKGIVAPLPKKNSNSEDEFPLMIGFQYLPKILEGIKDASVQGLYLSLAAEHVSSSWRPVRKDFQTLAQLFESQMHNFGLSMLVRAADFDGHIETAKGHVYRALERISRDQTLSEEEKTARASKVSLLLEDFE